MHLIHSVAVQNVDVGGDVVNTHDLSVHPLSVILICLRPLNDTGTLTEFGQYLTICDAINRLSVLHRGQSIISMTGRDAAALAYFRHGIQLLQTNNDNTNNDRRCVVLPILLGRAPYDPTSCFPASRAGELVLELDLDDADTGYDDLQYTVEMIELLGANPTEFERKVQLTRTFNSTGINDVDLPVGNILRGVLLFGTTGFTGAAPAPTWGRVSTVVDGIEIGYAGTDFEVAHGLHGLRSIQAPDYEGHQHGFEPVAGIQTLPPGSFDVGAGGYEQYSFLDLDPTRNDMLSIDSRGVSRLQIRADVETANAARVIPIERIAV